MKERKNHPTIANRFLLPKISPPLGERRSFHFRHAVGLVALFAPAAQGCGESAPCAASATCSPPDIGDAATADATTGATYDGAASADAEAGASHESSDGGSPGRDSASDERSLSDLASDRADDPTSDGDVGRDGAADHDATGDHPDDASIGNDPNDAGDGAMTSDGFGDATLDTTTDVPPDVPICDASPGRSPIDEPCIVDEQYGSFVSPAGNDTAGNGSRTAPFLTIGRGMRAAKLGSLRVFVCDNGTGYAEPIVADAATDGLAVYGGFDCKTWVPSASAQARVLPKSGPAVTVSQLTLGLTIENFDLRAADAALGASSIAARISGSVGVVFRRSRIAAGKGGAGADGRDGASGESGLAAGDAQRGLPPFCPGMPATQAGGTAVPSTCGATGGYGGPGSTSGLGSLSHLGWDGVPKTGVSPVNRSNAGTTCRSDTVTPGVADGSRGADGISGALGSPAPSGGTFSETGYAPSGPGGDGTPGNPGQGGGGGVGCPSSTTCVGPSGAAGGAGGCGGTQGTGGGPGGASVALLSWRSNIVLDRCEVLSADGGPGGKGGNGGSGGKGAAGGIGNDGYDGSDPSGAGGLGGEGGPGAAGAGGNGGPTYAIVFAGSRPVQMGTTLAISSGSAGGAGGTTPVSPISASRRAADGLLGDANYELVIP